MYTIVIFVTRKPELTFEECEFTWQHVYLQHISQDPSPFDIHAKNILTPTPTVQDYYEHKHLPLAYSLVSDVWPTTFHRRYFARICRKGFGGPANPDHPPLTLRGDMKSLDCDCIAELTFPDEKGFQRFYKKIYAKENAAILAEDEQKFLEQGSTTAVVVGETWSTGPDGVARSERADITKSDVSDSETSVGEVGM